MECVSSLFVQEMPVLKDAPRVKLLAAHRLMLSWRPLASSANTTADVVSAYIVEVMNSSTDNWQAFGSVPASPGTTKYSITVGGLRGNLRYKFRTRVVSLNNNKPQESVPGPETDWVEYSTKELDQEDDDDVDASIEDAYSFAARLLVTGHVTAPPSPPLGSLSPGSEGNGEVKYLMKLRLLKRSESELRISLLPFDRTLNLESSEIKVSRDD